MKFELRSWNGHGGDGVPTVTPDTYFDATLDDGRVVRFDRRAYGRTAPDRSVYVAERWFGRADCLALIHRWLDAGAEHGDGAILLDAFVRPDEWRQEPLWGGCAWVAHVA